MLLRGIQLLRDVQRGGIIPIKKPFNRFAEQIFLPPGGAEEKFLQFLQAGLRIFLSQLPAAPRSACPCSVDILKALLAPLGIALVLRRV
jgi:hypothetical protein